MYKSDEIEQIRKTGQILSKIYSQVTNALFEGTYLKDVEKYISNLLRLYEVDSCIQGFNGFPDCCCLSLNSIACHGTTSSCPAALRPGDALKVDIAIKKNGWAADACRTFFIVEGKQFDVLMYSFNKTLVYNTISHLNYLLQSRTTFGGPGDAYITPGDIAEYVKRKVDNSRIYACVADYGGHGVGREMHEHPYIPYDISMSVDKNFKLTNGSVFTIEPILTKREPKRLTRLMNYKGIKSKILSDKWSVKIKNTATQYEETVAIIDNKIEVLT